MKLYYNPLSTYSRKVLLALYEKGINCEREVVNLFDPQVRSHYAANVNPFGKIPHLVLDDGHQIPESSIIIEYLDKNFPGVTLIPNDPTQSRLTRFHDRVADLYLAEPVGSVFFENMKPEAERNVENLGKWMSTIMTSMALWNKHLEGKQFAMGDALTMADFSASAAIYWLQFGQPINDWPVVKAWFDRMMARDSWQRILKESEPFMANFHSAS